MSIVYQYYRQGSTSTIVLASASTSLSDTFNYANLNHLAVTSTVDCYVVVTDKAVADTATAVNGQFVMARTETIIPYIKARSLAAIAGGAGTLYVTEFIGA